MTTAPAAGEGLRVRTLVDTDADAVVALLLKGFDDRDEAYWRHALAALAIRAVPAAFPRYGYGLSADGRLVGVLLMIFAEADDGGLRGNVSSWYVEPDYRFYSSMLIAPALRLKDVTLINVSPAPHTLPTIAAQGFQRYVAGSMAALPMLGLPRISSRLERVAPSAAPEADRLARHAAMGCLSFTVTHRGHRYPFVFLPRPWGRNGIPTVQLVYCESLDSFVHFSGMLGRRLLLLGFPIVILDADGPLPGLVGYFFAGRKIKVFRGPNRPRLGDLADTELVLFGP